MEKAQCTRVPRVLTTTAHTREGFSDLEPSPLNSKSFQQGSGTSGYASDKLGA